ncbi:hypothetical protein K438DRAFT_1540219, partial [Mycena galopus ATCC 62051]
QLQLREVATDTVTLNLLTYLTSYSGVELLHFVRVGGRTQSQSNQLAETFLAQVLPRHADSLIYLSCPADYASRWSFGSHWADIIPRLRNAETLEFTVNR